MDDNKPQADRDIKREPEAEYLTEMAPALESKAFVWNTCSEKNLADRIAIKEKAVEDAERCASELREFLKAHISAGATAVEAIDTWNDLVDQVRRQHQEFQILVGVAGVTGAGKTSLLNALLGISEMLPSGQEQAGTAVPCLVSWNYDTHTDYPCRAEIHFQSLEETQIELKNMVQAVRARHEIDTFDDEDSSQKLLEIEEADAEVNGSLDKLQHVWPDAGNIAKRLVPECNDDEQLAAVADKVLQSNQDAIKLVKEGNKTMFHNSPQGLSAMVKGYLDSTSMQHGSGETSFAAWALIREVHLFLREDILKNGICLVDLPGVEDDVEARSKAARRFFNRLGVTIIVAPIHRAASEKTAQSLLRDHQRLCVRTKQSNFALVLSKMEDLDLNAALRGLGVAQSDAEIQEHQSAVAAANTQLRRLKTEQTQIQRKLNQARRTMQSARRMTSGRSGPNAAPIRDARDMRKNCRADLARVSRQMKESLSAIEMASAHLKLWAIVTRNANVRRHIQANIDTRYRQLLKDTANQTDTAHTTEQAVEIMPTSAKAFWTLRNDGRCEAGMPSEKHTGLPYVVQWVHKATAERREQHLDEMLERYATLTRGLSNWCNTVTAEFGSKLNIKEVEQAMKPAHREFKADLDTFFRELHSKVAELDPLDNPAKAKADFIRDATVIATQWSRKFPGDDSRDQQMAPGTYKAICRRRGDRYSPKRNPEIHYDWMQQLAEPISNTISETYDQRMSENSKAAWVPAEKKLQDIWSRYELRLQEIAAEIDPVLSNYFQSIKCSLRNTQDSIRCGVMGRLGAFKEAALPSCDEMKTALQLCMEGPFKLVGQLNSKEVQEVSKVRRRLVISHVMHNAPQMFDLSWDALKEAMMQSKEELAEQLAHLCGEKFHEVKTQVRMKLAGLIGDAGNGETSSLQALTRAKLADWQQKWAAPELRGKHILQQDMRIPETLVTSEMRKRGDSGYGVGEGGDSDDDESGDCDSDMDSD